MMGKVSIRTQTWILPKINLSLKEKHGEGRTDRWREGRKKSRKTKGGKEGGGE